MDSPPLGFLPSIKCWMCDSINENKFNCILSPVIHGVIIGSILAIGARNNSLTSVDININCESGLIIVSSIY